MTYSSFEVCAVDRWRAHVKVNPIMKGMESLSLVDFMKKNDGKNYNKLVMVVNHYML